jgi:hypothetical protein
LPVFASLLVTLDAPSKEVNMGYQGLLRGEAYPIPARIPAISSRKASASAWVPFTIRHQSSAYAEVRVMPTLALVSLVRAVSGFLISA